MVKRFKREDLKSRCHNSTSRHAHQTKVRKVQVFAARHSKLTASKVQNDSHASESTRQTCKEQAFTDSHQVHVEKRALPAACTADSREDASTWTACCWEAHAWIKHVRNEVSPDLLVSAVSGWRGNGGRGGQMSYHWWFTSDTAGSVHTQKEPLMDSDLLVLTICHYDKAQRGGSRTAGFLYCRHCIQSS